jgi:excisionase family DNA binding protein
MRPLGPRRQERVAKKTGLPAVGVNDAARLIGISIWTIRGYVARGMIRSVRVGSQILLHSAGL